MRFLLAALAPALLACATTGTPAATPTDTKADQTALNQVLTRYEHALNSSNVEAIAGLYADDAVFMPQHVPAAVGRDAIEKLYGTILAAISLDIEFAVDELHVIGNTAWARTRSKGTVTPRATGEKHSEGNQELFLFERSPAGAWKIARYIFTTTNPPAAR